MTGRSSATEQPTVLWRIHGGRSLHYLSPNASPRSPCGRVANSSSGEVWGAQGFLTDGARYNPFTDTWTPMAASPLSGRLDERAVWSDREVIIWGGTQRFEGLGQLGDGAAYDPVSDSWRVLSPAPLTGRYGHGAVWTGRQMIVWGGSDEITGDNLPGLLQDGASYDPASNAWTPLPPSPLAARYGQVAVWTGEELIVWGGCCKSVFGADGFRDGAAYRPD